MAPVPRFVRVAYCIVAVAAFFPVTLSSSSWVRLSLGGSMGLVPPIFVLPLLLMAVYRIVLVIQNANTLAAPPAAGVAKVIRGLGVVMLAFGAFIFALNIVLVPLMQQFMSSQTERGGEHLGAGFYLAALGSIGTFGLLLFEFARLLAFEAAARRAVS